MNTKVDEGKLISGKEALIALCDGLKVEYRMKGASNWGNDQKTIYLNLNNFMTGQYEFRLKPHTILINGIEVPSVRYIAHSGGNCVKISCHCPEDARVINAALRQVFGGSHDN